MESSNSKQNKLKGLAFWVAVIGLFGVIIGAIGGWLSIWDRLTPPGLNMIEILPVCISAPRLPTQSHESVFGISAIVRCRAGNRTVFVSGLDFLGKMYLSAEEYITFTDKHKRVEIEREVSLRKPYFSILWNGWPEDQGSSVRLEPYEEKYIRFVFLAPKPFFYVREGGSPHLGYADGTKQPDRIGTSPNLYDIFKLRLNIEQEGQRKYAMWTPYGLREDIREGNLQFQIRVGARQITIPPEGVIGFRLITQQDWKNKTPQQLFHENVMGFEFNPNTEKGKNGNKDSKDFRGYK
jgi:hypothetical protein